MKHKVTVGDIKRHYFTVTEKDIAAFWGQTVHRVCSTFVLAREIEWSTRLYVLDMIAEDEEGIGTELTIKHRAPALVGETVEIEATVVSFARNELLCNYKATVGSRVVAEGITGQKILKRNRIREIFSTFET